MVLWLRIFQYISSQEDARQLSQKSYGAMGAGNDHVRLTRVLDYVHQHFSEPIKLASIAQIDCMNEAAFCRYFKAQTQKTFTQALHEIRLSFACRLLLDSSHSISQVAMESGFSNFSHFHQSFRLLMGVSPSAYRKKLRYRLASRNIGSIQVP